MRAIALPAFAVALVACGSSDPGPAGPRDAGAAGSADAGARLTWFDDVAPIAYSECSGCHREGGIAPFSMFDTAAVVASAPLMKQHTATRTMPPMPANNDGSCQTYSNARWLTQAQIDTIGTWVDQGRVLGDPSHEPARPPAPAGLTGSTITLDIGTSYMPHAQASSPDDDYHCFVVDPGMASMQYMTGYQVMPGDARVVHHLIVYAVPDAAAEAQVDANDAAEAGPGYTCFGGPGLTRTTPIALWAPGGGATVFPTDTGIALEPGHRVVVQIHYNLLGGSFPDRTSVLVQLAPTVARPAGFIPILDLGIRLPPGMPHVEHSATIMSPRLGSGTIWGWAPHMHTLGTTMRVELASGGECVGDVDRWDFHWQSLWWYSTPIAVTPALLSGGVRITCGYDTTSRSDTVTWGESTTDEMCIAYFYVSA